MKHTSRHYRLVANTLRFLSLDAVERARSGHPGMPLGLADVAAVLWLDFLRLSPWDPEWQGRDRLVLSNGHGSMLLYAMSHLAGYPLTMVDLQNFRQLGSPTSGHPELDRRIGVETTTGPLGQGLANAVGMALAKRHQGYLTDDARVYCFVGDGCLMEGISHEAAALAGHWQLPGLVVMWDDNGISIDGATELATSEDTLQRFRAYGWHTLAAVDGHDYQAIQRALTAAQAQSKPVFIQIQTTIGQGLADLAGSAKVHGAPAGEQAIAKMRADLQWSWPAFTVPDEVVALFADRQQQWRAHYQKWQAHATAVIPAPDWSALLADAQAEGKAMATRQASHWVLKRLGQREDFMVGSADLTPSVLTQTQEMRAFGQDSPKGRYLHFGVREFAMMAIANGMALTGLRIAIATFLVFMDYGRSAMRMAAMMRLPVIYVLTHDSVALGEDGPTHQPMEHLAICRATPQLELWRPASLLETAVAWQQAWKNQGPTVLALSRQTLPSFSHDVTAIERGAYQVYQSKGKTEVIFFATGSELATLMANISALEAVAGAIRIISMPSMDRFDKQDEAYQAAILDWSVARRVIFEAGVAQAWHAIGGRHALYLTTHGFGASAPAQDALRQQNLDIESVLLALTQYVYP